MPLLRDAVLMFMKANPRPICSACLSRALRVSFDRVMDAWADIRLRDDLPIRAGKCSAYGRAADELIGPRL
jgi:hypothetical protein